MFGPDGISFKPMSLCLGKDLAVIIRQCQCNFSAMDYRRGLESAEQIWYNTGKLKEPIYEPTGDKRVSRAYLL